MCWWVVAGMDEHVVLYLVIGGSYSNCRSDTELPATNKMTLSYYRPGAHCHVSQRVIAVYNMLPNSTLWKDVERVKASDV